jgi:sulfur carrier protein ThiS
MTEGTIDVRAFMWLATLFSERGWPNPRAVAVADETTGPALLEILDIPRERVEALILNHTTVPVEGTVLRPGDRVALVPPGVPGPHRLLLGLHGAKKKNRAPKQES